MGSTRVHDLSLKVSPEQNLTGPAIVPGQLKVTHFIPLPAWTIPVAIGVVGMVGVAVWQLVSE